MSEFVGWTIAELDDYRASLQDELMFLNLRVREKQFVLSVLTKEWEARMKDGGGAA